MGENGEWIKKRKIQKPIQTQKKKDTYSNIFTFSLGQKLNAYLQHRTSLHQRKNTEYLFSLEVFPL